MIKKKEIKGQLNFGPKPMGLIVAMSMFCGKFRSLTNYSAPILPECFFRDITHCEAQVGEYCWEMLFQPIFMQAPVNSLSAAYIVMAWISNHIIQ